MEGFLEFFKITGPWAAGLLGFWIVLNIIGEICEKKNKIVPEFMKIVTHIKRKNEEKLKRKTLLVDVKTLLEDVNKHYNNDNIERRNAWMKKVDENIQDYQQTAEEVAKMKLSLDYNSELTNKLYLSSTRNRILDFAELAAKEDTPLLRESFTRIFKDYEEYEAFLKLHNMKNGEVEAAHKIIVEEYERRLRSQSFIEDQRWKRD